MHIKLFPPWMPLLRFVVECYLKLEWVTQTSLECLGFALIFPANKVVKRSRHPSTVFACIELFIATFLSNF